MISLKFISKAKPSHIELVRVISQNLKFFSFPVAAYDENTLEEVKKKAAEGIELLPDNVKNIIPKDLNVNNVPSIEEGEELLKERCDRYGTNESFDNAMVSLK